MTFSLPVGTRVRILPPRDCRGRKLLDHLGHTGRQGTVTFVEPAAPKNGSPAIFITIDGVVGEWRFGDDRLTIVKSSEKDAANGSKGAA